MSTARYEREGRRQEPWNKKTRLCRRFQESGKCPFGHDCNFAHGPEELRVFSEWDPEQWSAEDKVEDNDESIPCIPDEIYFEHDVAPQDPEYHYQGVDVGNGWLRYWDDSENANYYFRPETGETTWQHPFETREQEGHDEQAESSIGANSGDDGGDDGCREEQKEVGNKRLREERRPCPEREEDEGGNEGEGKADTSRQKRN